MNPAGRFISSTALILVAVIACQFGMFPIIGLLALPLILLLLLPVLIFAIRRFRPR